MVERMMARAIRYIAMRDRSEKEIVDYLNKKMDRRSKSEVKREEKEERGKIIEVVVEKLKVMGLVDDNEFAIKWVGARHRGGRGPVRIGMELTQKGIEKDSIKKALMTIADSEWEEIAKNLVDKRARQWQKLDQRHRREKMLRFLVYRGFPLVTVRSVIDQVTKEG